MNNTNRRLRVLITGFGPFPGAPFNPTQRLVARLMGLRRPAFADIERTCHIFNVTYGDVDRDLPRLLAERAPDVLLMFGLATRTPHVRIETRARNAITTIWPDAGHTRIGLGKIAAGQADALTFGPHTARLLRAALATDVAREIIPRCRTLPLQLPVLARDRGERRLAAVAADGVHPCAAGAARHSLAAQGRAAARQLRAAGRRRRSDPVRDDPHRPHFTGRFLSRPGTAGSGGRSRQGNPPSV